jgi:OTU domain-containing protein 3
MGPKLKNVKKKDATKSRNLKKDSYLTDDNNYKPFSAQLNLLGLELRDITGDGNCCFRSLSDQMVGNESKHLEYRRSVCNYMRQNRNEFEPFIAALIDEDGRKNDLNEL